MRRLFEPDFSPAARCTPPSARELCWAMPTVAPSLFAEAPHDDAELHHKLSGPGICAGCCGTKAYPNARLVHFEDLKGQLSVASDMQAGGDSDNQAAGGAGAAAPPALQRARASISKCGDCKGLQE